MRRSVDATLTLLRREGKAGVAARSTVAFGPEDAARPERERLRADVAAELAANLQPSDRGLTQWLLQQEIAEHLARGSGASESLYTLVAALARFAQPSDSLLIWYARQATPETQAGVDVEQLARGGVDATRAWLRRLVSEGGPLADDARQALRCIDDSAAEGAFDDLPTYFLWADERFGLNVSGPT